MQQENRVVVANPSGISITTKVGKPSAPPEGVEATVEYGGVKCSGVTGAARRG